jgi:hypothetical protein
MYLAEALAARKDKLTEIDAMRERIVAAASLYEDEEPSAHEDAASLLARMGELLAGIEELNVRINRTNNSTTFVFERKTRTLMEAVALRDRLLLEQRVRKAVVEGLEVALGRGRMSFERRSKDDVRRVVSLKPAEMRASADAVAARIRMLDLAMQRANWSTELAE